MMVNKVVALTCEVPDPLPGDIIHLTVDLDQVVVRPNVAIRLDAKRILLGANGAIELHPTGDGYFKLPPKPIPVAVTAAKGTSDGIQLADPPTAGPGEPPIVFPELLLFIAYDDTGDQTISGFHARVVPISTHPHMRAR
jgi:hypothetical protein